MQFLCLLLQLLKSPLCIDKNGLALELSAANIGEYILGVFADIEP
jgi:hypothetical protein